MDEYRKYWDERMVARKQLLAEEASADGTASPSAEALSTDGTAVQEVEVSELTARFVAASCEHEPTDEEWRACLLGAGYSEEKVSLILSGGNAEG